MLVKIFMPSLGLVWNIVFTLGCPESERDVANVSWAGCGTGLGNSVKWPHYDLCCQGKGTNVIFSDRETDSSLVSALM